MITSPKSWGDAGRAIALRVAVYLAVRTAIAAIERFIAPRPLAGGH
jgi:hypothetical protein